MGTKGDPWSDGERDLGRDGLFIRYALLENKNIMLIRFQNNQPMGDINYLNLCATGLPKGRVVGKVAAVEKRGQEWNRRREAGGGDGRHNGKHWSDLSC